MRWASWRASVVCVVDLPTYWAEIHERLTTAAGRHIVNLNRYFCIKEQTLA